MNHEKEFAAPEDFDPIAYINEPRWMESRLGLERISQLLELLGSPHQELKFVHVAGTNGKGSTCKMLSSVLQEASYKVGLFTSPYIIEFADRIQINGINISFKELRNVTLEVKKAADTMKDHPTEFELMTAVAFLYFAWQNCDIVVCEVGMGGRLDSTNVIKSPEITIITQIAFDHMEMLGNSIDAIAQEKAGIIKQGVPVVSWPQESEAMQVVKACAQKKNAAMSVPDFLQLRAEKPVPTHIRSFSYKKYEGICLGLKGSYQPYNAALVIESLEVLRKQGWQIDETALRAGLKKVKWPGRFEIIASNPTLIIDGAHNAQGAEALARSLKEYFPEQGVVFIMGVLEDKDYLPMIDAVLPFAQALITVTPPNPRALSASALRDVVCEKASRQGSLLEPSSIYLAKNFPDALDHAKMIAKKEGIVCAFGSLYSVSEIKSTQDA